MPVNKAVFCGRDKCEIREGALGRVGESVIGKLWANIFGVIFSISSSLSPERLLLAQVDHEAERSLLIAQLTLQHADNGRPQQANREIRRSCVKVFSRGPLQPVRTLVNGPALICLQAATYGKCIVADYQSVHQDMCKKEFMRLKDCYLVRCQLSQIFQCSSIVY